MDVAVIDYGIGNLFSVCRAIEACGAKPVLIHTPEEILSAPILILPGVGAFPDGMRGLDERQLIEPVKEYAASGRPLLGICLGMQMLLETGEEFGIHDGLGLIPGTVQAIPSVGLNGKNHKIPHIGWNNLLKPHPKAWEESILDNVMEGESSYFVHSFTALPSESGYRLADCNYNGVQISAVIRSGNVYGTQFHPEKSGPTGLKILGNFIALAR